MSLSVPEGTLLVVAKMGEALKAPKSEHSFNTSRAPPCVSLCTLLTASASRPSSVKAGVIAVTTSLKLLVREA